MAGDDHALVSKWGVILEVPLVIPSKAVDRVAQGTGGASLFPMPWAVYSLEHALSFGSCTLSYFQFLPEPEICPSSPQCQKNVFYVLENIF